MVNKKESNSKSKEKDTIKQRIANFEKKEREITKEFNETISGLSLLL